MGAVKKQKNVVIDTTIDTNGNVTIGDQQTFHVYGLPTSKNGIIFFAACFMLLLVLFAISAVVFVYWPDSEERLAVFICGAAFVLCLYFLLELLRTLSAPPININSKT